MAASTESEERRVLSAISKLLGVTLSTDSIETELRNGVLLCRLLNKVQSGLVPIVNEADDIVSYLENFSSYLQGCWALRLPTSVMFGTQDLLLHESDPYKRKKKIETIVANIDCVLALTSNRPNFSSSMHIYEDMFAGGELSPATNPNLDANGHHKDSYHAVDDDPVSMDDLYAEIAELSEINAEYCDRVKQYQGLLADMDHLLAERDEEVLILREALKTVENNLHAHITEKAAATTTNELLVQQLRSELADKDKKIASWEQGYEESKEKYRMQVNDLNTKVAESQKPSKLPRTKSEKILRRSATVGGEVLFVAQAENINSENVDQTADIASLLAPVNELLNHPHRHAIQLPSNFAILLALTQPPSPKNAPPAFPAFTTPYNVAAPIPINPDMFTSRLPASPPMSPSTGTKKTRIASAPIAAASSSPSPLSPAVSSSPPAASSPATRRLSVDKGSNSAPSSPLLRKMKGVVNTLTIKSPHKPLKISTARDTRDLIQNIFTSAVKVTYDEVQKLSFESDTSRRLFCLLLDDQMKSCDKAMFSLSDYSFEILLYLVNSMLQEMEKIKETDTTALRVLLNTSELYRSVPPIVPAIADEDLKRESILHHIKHHEIWKRNEFWMDYFFYEISQNKDKSVVAVLSNVVSRMLDFNLTRGVVYRLIDDVKAKKLATVDDMTAFENALSHSSRMSNGTSDLIKSAEQLSVDYSNPSQPVIKYSDVVTPTMHHAFVKMIAPRPSFCYYCKEFIMGTAPRVFVCQECKYTIHTKCVNDCFTNTVCESKRKAKELPAQSNVTGISPSAQDWQLYLVENPQETLKSLNIDPALQRKLSLVKIPIAVRSSSNSSVAEAYATAATSGQGANGVAGVVHKQLPTIKDDNHVFVTF